MNTSDHTTKLCPRCNKSFPKTSHYWYRDSRKRDGLYTYCKRCWIEYTGERTKTHPRKEYHHQRYILKGDDIRQKQRIYRENNRDKERERHRKYYETNKETIREKNRVHSRNYYRTHLDKVRKYSRDNVERIKENSRIHRKLKPEMCNALYRKWRNRKLNAEGSFTEIEVMALFREQEGYCFHCGADLILIGFQRDHWIPLSRGGSDYIENIRLLCPHCNHSKGAMLPHEWHPEKYSPDD